MPSSSAAAGPLLRPALLALLLLALLAAAALDPLSEGEAQSPVVPASAADAAPRFVFSHASGNARWVQVQVEPEGSVVRVEATLDGRTWWPLRPQPWGGWASPREVPEGSVLQFRASGTDGAVAYSACHSWPVAAEVDCLVRELRDITGEVQSLSFGPLGIETPPEEAGPASISLVAAERWVVLGDTGTSGATRRNVQASLAEGAVGILGTGDYWYDDQPTRWLEMFRPLLERGAWLVMGNHDAQEPLRERLPRETWWSAHVGGARVVGLDSTKPVAPGTPQHAFARDALCGAEEPLRVLMAHHNWWLLEGARHPGDEFPAAAHDMERLVSDCGVDLVLVGHEHNYQRMMRGGVAYVVVGTGGQSLYPATGTPEGTVAAVAEYGRLLLDLAPDGYAARFLTLDGGVRDAFEGSAHAVHEAPSVPPVPFTFDHRGGGGYWVEVGVAPRPSAVEAMATGGAWRPLEPRSWGAWAASLRIDDGAEVRFRARSGGDWVESCWFSHPAGHERCGT